MKFLLMFSDFFTNSTLENRILSMQLMIFGISKTIYHVKIYINQTTSSQNNTFESSIPTKIMTYACFYYPLLPHSYAQHPPYTSSTRHKLQDSLIIAPSSRATAPRHYTNSPNYVAKSSQRASRARFPPPLSKHSRWNNTWLNVGAAAVSGWRKSSQGCSTPPVLATKIFTSCSRRRKIEFKAPHARVNYPTPEWDCHAKYPFFFSSSKNVVSYSRNVIYNSRTHSSTICIALVRHIIRKNKKNAIRKSPRRCNCQTAKIRQTI